MQAISCYRMSHYAAIDLSQSLPSSPVDLMSPMHLIMSATVKIITTISESNSEKFRNEYPNWKYFLGEVKQYVGQDNVSLPFTLY